MDKQTLDKLKKHFHKSVDVGASAIKKSKSFIKKRPVESALFTILAANIIKRQSKKD